MPSANAAPVTDIQVNGPATNATVPAGQLTSLTFFAHAGQKLVAVETAANIGGGVYHVDVRGHSGKLVKSRFRRGNWATAPFDIPTTGVYRVEIKPRPGFGGTLSMAVRDAQVSVNTAVPGTVTV